eukprot:79110-Prorocentrum_minimum.AAC.1
MWASPPGVTKHADGVVTRWQVDFGLTRPPTSLARIRFGLALAPRRCTRSELGTHTDSYGII